MVAYIWMVWMERISHWQHAIVKPIEDEDERRLRIIDIKIR